MLKLNREKNRNRKEKFPMREREKEREKPVLGEVSDRAENISVQ